MIEQSKGVGIPSLATHEDGAVPVQLDDGSWRSVLSFPDLPLHSGDYVISAFLFDETGLAVYDEWFQFLHFSFIFPKPLPGLVRLPQEGQQRLAQGDRAGAAQVLARAREERDTVLAAHALIEGHDLVG